MADTTNLGLPLVAPAQAQKHVTVNEAFARLDGLTQLRLLSITQSAPPASIQDGESYGIPAGATGAWAGQDGMIAVGSNGGWVFVAPAAGWRAFVADQSRLAVHDGAGWAVSAMAVSVNRAHAVFEIVEFDHVVGAGATSSVSWTIPAHSMVFSVSGRVKTAITGTLSSWQVGVSGGSSWFANGLGLSAGTSFAGVPSWAKTYYSATGIVLSAVGGDFAAGEVRMAVQYFTARPPEV